MAQKIRKTKATEQDRYWVLEWDLLDAIREQVDQYLFEECQDIAASSIKIRARSPK